MITIKITSFLPAAHFIISYINFFLCLRAVMNFTQACFEVIQDEKQDALLDVKLMRNEDETFTLSSKEAGSLQERSLTTNLKSGLVKEEQEDKYGVTEKTEVNIFVTMKTEQSDDLTQSEVISKFSKSTDDDLIVQNVVLSM
ncbi:uncharacterized protein LOC143237334 isoform X5 [Tachypleus tridentatus]|uniref:uncharacterized protein LOC143237334 isoform X5 n=1 Tax=Tachypleus tridentatus TaxID=6853 RepID=UPI003FD026D1